MTLSFKVQHRCTNTQARSGLINTGRGSIETPVFMPVGTAGSVKAMTMNWLEQLDCKIILTNTYHLYLRPGLDVIAEMGGLHRFISWPRPILTDSGGYQVFSHQGLNRITEEGVTFQSHLDGSRHFLSPERSIEIQKILGADIIMAFDECTPYPVSQSEARDSMLRSMRWAQRSKSALGESLQALFGIVQGSVFYNLRLESLHRIEEMDFPGVALGGFSVGEPRLLMYELLEKLGQQLPDEKPHYLMGVGTPLDLIRAIQQGIDMFDCVLPTRNGRNGTLFTWNGIVRIKNARYSDDERPIDPECECIVCQRHSRAYLRHLYRSREISASILNTCHNLYFYLDLMRRIRESIALDSLQDLEEKLAERYTASS